MHDGDQPISGGNIGQYVNGADASDFYAFSAYSTIQTGGTILENGSYVLSNGDKLKNLNGANTNGGMLIDQLPGNQQFTIINVNNTANTFQILCRAGHAIDVYCPSPGTGPFTGFTRGGTLITSESQENFGFRPVYDPGPGQGYADVKLCWIRRRDHNRTPNPWI